MKTSSFSKFAIAFATLCTISSCITEPRTEEKAPKQLNISILLDLSDRISPKHSPATPSHMERDTAIVGQIIRLFKTDMNKRGAYDAKGRLQVLMSPPPRISNINSLQEKLQINLAKMDNKQKKDTYTDIQGDISTALTEIYTETNRQSRWTGSDIWRFFQNDVEDLCIARDTNYRNILVILTDGYIFDEKTNLRSGSRVQCLSRQYLTKYRAAADPLAAIDNDDFGLIPANKNLGRLEVLFLEITPENNDQKDEAILKYCLDKWMKEMGISRWSIYTTDLPANTSRRIEDFIQAE